MSHLGVVLFIEHHTNFIILYPCKQYNENIMNLIAVILTQYWFFLMKLKMKRTSQFAWKKITYCQILNFRFLTTFFLICWYMSKQWRNKSHWSTCKGCPFCKFVHIFTDRNKPQKTSLRTHSWFYKVTCKTVESLLMENIKSKMTLFCSWYLI